MLATVLAASKGRCVGLPRGPSSHVKRFSVATKRDEWIYHSETGVVSRRRQGESFAEPLFQSVIGMEIHAQLAIPTKLFSSAPTSHDDTMRSKIDYAPNTAVWPLDVAVPGVLPRLSREAVLAAVITAASCQCHIPMVSRFERKHYAYADLPLGYQVTQQRWPLAVNGKLTCRRRVGSLHKTDPPKKSSKRRRGQPKNKQDEQRIQSEHTEHQTAMEQSKFFTVGIDRIQLEQDTGKTTTATNREVDSDGNESVITESFVDFNRAGCALVEIVLCPDMRSSTEAASVVSTLRSLLRHVGTCDGKMEEGSLRCDLNVSIAPINGDIVQHSDDDNPFQESLPPGTGHRVEVKNLNSVKDVLAAAEYEALRQARALTSGSPTGRETRTFNVRTGETVAIRAKGGAVDYRFMPEPDLPPVVLNKETFDGKTLDEFLAFALPELPEEVTSRLVEEYGISEDVSLVIASDRDAISIYEVAVEAARKDLGESSTGDTTNEQLKQVRTMVANWLTNDLFALVRDSATRRREESHSSDSKTLDEDETTELNQSISDSTVNGNQLGLLVAMILDGTVSTTMAKKILTLLFHEEPTGTSPREVAESRGFQLISDPVKLRQLCHKVILDHEAQLQQYQKGGKHVAKMEKFFVGQAMKASKGNAHPEFLRDALRHVLQEVAPDVDENK